MNLSELVEDFILYIKSKNFSENTVISYKNDLLDFISYVQDKKLEEPDEALIENFIADRSKYLSEATVERRLASIKSFYRFLETKGIKNEAEDVVYRKRAKTLPSILTISEMDKLLSSVSKDKKRDIAIMETLYGCGLRVSEIASLDIENINFEKNELLVRGKGKKERIVPLGSFAKKAILDYIKDRKEGPLFLNRYNKRLSVRFIRHIVSMLSIKSEIQKRIYPHIFRHSYATHMLQSGADIRVIQELLGHENLSTTQKYTHISFPHILNVYRNTHPRAKKGKNK